MIKEIGGETDWIFNRDVTDESRSGNQALSIFKKNSAYNTIHSVDTATFSSIEAKKYNKIT